MELDHVQLSSERAEKRKRQHKPEVLGSVAIEDSEKTHHKPRPEHIGHMLMSAEPKPKSLSKQRVETMNRAQLLSLSEKIKIDGSSLRQIYETHLIGERGLRHLVAEYVHDGDLKQALREEVVERERDFERDPAMRHIADEVSLADDPAKSNATLEALLAKADLTSDQQREETAFFKARARFEAQQLQQHKRQRRVIDISLAVFISVLLLLIILLFLKRG